MWLVQCQFGQRCLGSRPAGPDVELWRVGTARRCRGRLRQRQRRLGVGQLRWLADLQLAGQQRGVELVLQFALAACEQVFARDVAGLAQQRRPARRRESVLRCRLRQQRLRRGRTDAAERYNFQAVLAYLLAMDAFVWVYEWLAHSAWRLGSEDGTCLGAVRWDCESGHVARCSGAVVPHEELPPELAPWMRSVAGAPKAKGRKAKPKALASRQGGRFASSAGAPAEAAPVGAVDDTVARPGGAGAADVFLFDHDATLRILPRT